MEEIIFKCGACGKEGLEKEFEDEYGNKECSWCATDTWLDTLENHNAAN